MTRYSTAAADARRAAVAATLALALPALALAGQVPAGTYLGTTSQGMPITLVVQPAGELDSWTVEYDCPGFSSTSTTNPGSCPISGDSFSCGPSGCAPFVSNVRLQGTFTGNSVTGSVTVNHVPAIGASCCVLPMSFTAALEGTGCVEDDHTLCLRDQQFRVTATFDTVTGSSGDCRVEPLTSDTGYMYFTNPANVEAVIKVLNGCGVNNRYWVFAGGLTNVNLVITVTDTQTGAVRTYENPQQTPFQPIQDTDAFATCP